MKEGNYTQKTFLKEYKEKYGGGTQANISRWLRVGNKIENGKTIGFPSYETMLNLADFLAYQWDISQEKLIMNHLRWKRHVSF